MDFSWLGNIFNVLLNVFGPLKGIQHWAIWAELGRWYARFRKWRDWYRDHVLTPMRRMQQMQRQIFDLYMRPILSLVDRIRRITGIIAIFNRRLADRLNYYFLRVEQYLLGPFNRGTARQNELARIFDSILTPGGLLDRDGILNTIWRDASLVKSVLSNPLDQHTPPTAAPRPQTTRQVYDQAREYFRSGGGDFAADIHDLIDAGRAAIGQIEE